MKNKPDRKDIYNLAIIEDISERKKAEDDLRKSELDLKEAHSIAQLGRWELDLNDNKLSWSDTIFEIFEIDKKKFGATYEAFIDAIHPDDREEVNLAYKESLKTKKPYSIEHRLQMKDGRIKWVLEKCRTEFDDHGKALRSIGIVQDITEQKKTERALIESEKKNRIWLENSPVCTKIVDLDFNLQYMSAAGIRDLKIDDITEFYGKPYPLYFYPDSFKIQMSVNLKRAKETGEIIAQEGLILDVDGSELWYSSTIVPVNDDKGQLDYLMVVSLETTKRKQAEDKLRESNERYDLAVNATKDGIFDWNLLTDEVYYSPAWKSMLGYKDDELPNDISVWEKLMDAEHVKKSWEVQNEVINHKRDRFEMYFKMKHKDGHWVDIHARSEPVFDKSGKVVRMVGTHVDITERKQAENELIKHRENLEELIKDRTKELEEKNKKLERFNKLFVDREFRIKELRDEIAKLKELEKKLGE